MFALMAIQPGRRHGIDIGAIVRRALRKAPSDDVVLQKQAALEMGVSMSALSRALNGCPGYPLDLWKVAELPAEIQAQVYGRILEALYARKQMAKADLRERKEGAA